MCTKVERQDDDREADGRWVGSLIQETRWGGLCDKNSDKLFAPRQLIPKSYYDQHFRT